MTCYTRSLASQLRAELADCRNVEVRNLDKLMAAAVNEANMEFPTFAKLPAAAVKAQAQNPNSPKFRAVLVDEAQDFDTEALQFCVNLLESTDPDEQDLVRRGGLGAERVPQEVPMEGCGHRRRGARGS